MPFPIRNLLLVTLVLAMTALAALIMFTAAGTWRLPFFWAYIAVVAAVSVAALLLMDPGLLKERFRPGPGGRDRWVIHLLKLLLWAHLILAGLDVGRLHWSDTVPLVVQIVGLAGFAAGFGLAIWAMVVNRFFSTVVRLQEDRGHHLITTGPYAWVRHPGYTGILVGMLSSPLALGSWLSGVPTVLFALLILRRTIIEDRFLKEHLPGYVGYAGRIRYRLLPAVW